jgi:hypothetical protein
VQPVALGEHGDEDRDGKCLHGCRDLAYAAPLRCAPGGCVAGANDRGSIDARENSEAFYLNSRLWRSVDPNLTGTHLPSICATGKPTGTPFSVPSMRMPKFGPEMTYGVTG